MANSDIRIVLLDNGNTGKWRIFSNPGKILQAKTPAEVLPVLQEVEQSVENGLQAAGFISYEAASGFDNSLKTHASKGLPLAWFCLFEGSKTFVLPVDGSFSVGKWETSLSRERYVQALDRIKSYLKAGDTYQVNYTMRLRADFTGDPLVFFSHLQATQRAKCCAYVETDDFAICSASPELFFRLDGEKLISRPMKGTSGRGLTLNADMVLSAELAKSEKNRAENVMIVDMVRNDMGRVADPGSVDVPTMFEIEKYPTLFQMTSTVGCKTQASFTDIISALFPCASITGAPKVRTMEIIKELEREPRGIYTGCIGCIQPGRKADFNVAIRTVMIDKKKEQAEYGVGGGIVWDSKAEREYEECFVKAAVLTANTPRFNILETILWDAKSGGYFLLDKHLERMQMSAEYFDYPCDRAVLEKKLGQVSTALNDGTYRVRLQLTEGGEVLASCDPFSASDKPWRVAVASVPVNSGDLFLYHKTTNRSVYDSARPADKAIDDVILCNEKGEITESTLANVVVEKNRKLLTPPVSCGLLAGVFREWLLETDEIKEGIVSLKDLKAAKHVYLVNSVRKWIAVEIQRRTGTEAQSGDGGGE